MICYLIEHGFLPVFSIEGKVMLHYNVVYVGKTNVFTKSGDFQMAIKTVS